MPHEEARCRRGLVRLMLRLPAVRSELQILSARSDEVKSLCGAFEDAHATLETLRRSGRPQIDAAVIEYQNLCDDIESDILSLCRKEMD